MERQAGKQVSKFPEAEFVFKFQRDFFLRFLEVFKCSNDVFVLQISTKRKATLLGSMTFPCSAYNGRTCWAALFSAYMLRKKK